MKDVKLLYIYSLLFSLFCLSYDVKAQGNNDTILYDLIVDDEVIGDMLAVKYANEDSTIQYRVISNVDYKFLFSFHITFLYESMFSTNGKYTSSQFKYTMNEDVKESNWINNVGGKWYVFEENEVKSIIEDEINQTAVQLYFMEPAEELVVFSERFCDFYTIEKEEDDGYRIEFPGGTNRYYYKDGICYRIAINTIFSDMEFRQRPY